MRIKVSLKKVHFFAKHGYYAYEQLVGNDFIVNLNCYFLDANDYFVNYEDLFAITQNIMVTQQPEKFLETLAKNIIEAIQLQYPFLQQIDIEIIKTKPPIPSFNGEGASVKITWKQTT